MSGSSFGFKATSKEFIQFPNTIPKIMANLSETHWYVPTQATGTVINHTLTRFLNGRFSIYQSCPLGQCRAPSLCSVSNSLWPHLWPEFQTWVMTDLVSLLSIGQNDCWGTSLTARQLVILMTSVRTTLKTYSITHRRSLQSINMRQRQAPSKPRVLWSIWILSPELMRLWIGSK